MDVSATDISANTFRPRTFRPCKINLCTFKWIDVDVCGGCMYIYLHACMQSACMCDALLWFSS